MAYRLEDRLAADTYPHVRRGFYKIKLLCDTEGVLKQGLPTVRLMAAQLALSPRYLSDLLKQETGKTALEHIHLFLLEEAKKLLMHTPKTVAQTAYQLGFENPSYFSRLFKKEVGLTPVAYKERFLN